MFSFRSLFSPRADDRAQKYRDACVVLNRVFTDVESLVRVGITSTDLDRSASEAIAHAACEPLFRDNPRNHYPATVTASVNDQVVNSIPSSRPLESGDLLSLQIGLRRASVFAYQAWTYLVGGVSERDRQLWHAGYDALRNAVAQVQAGATVRDVSTAIQSTLESAGCEPGHDFVGHGIGNELHVDPPIPCFVSPGRSQDKVLGHKFVKDQLLSINVFGHAGSYRTKTDVDQWGLVTRDGSKAVHFSHIVMVRPGGCDVLTADRSHQKA